MGGDGWVASVPCVALKGEAVHAEGMGDEVEVLAFVADGVCPAEPEGVVERSVDGLGVVAAPVQRCEVRVRGWDRADVLGAVEASGGVVGGAVERTVMVSPPRWSGSR